MARSGELRRCVFAMRVARGRPVMVCAPPREFLPGVPTRPRNSARQRSAHEQRWKHVGPSATCGEPCYQLCARHALSSITCIVKGARMAHPRAPLPRHPPCPRQDHGHLDLLYLWTHRATCSNARDPHDHGSRPGHVPQTRGVLGGRHLNCGQPWLLPAGSRKVSPGLSSASSCSRPCGCSFRQACGVGR